MFPNRLFPSRFSLLFDKSADAEEFMPRGEDQESSQPLPSKEDKALSPRNRIPKRSRSRNNAVGKGISSEGLCANCDHRLHCTMRSQEGGVWHCEEYR